MSRRVDVRFVRALALRIWWGASLAAYLLLALWNLGLPGLHYDEAREAGVNAMELLTGAPVTAFRDAALQIGNVRLPLMVQDYIGALNVYLSLPFLTLTGIGVPNLRWLSVLIGALTLVVLERLVSEWLATHRRESTDTPPLSIGGLVAMTLAACSPAFVFWSRQGIFVTNGMILGVLLSLWVGVRWLRTGKQKALVLSALAAGFALYAKLLAVWVLAPFAVMLAVGYWLLWRGGARQAPGAGAIGAALTAGILPLLPLLLFNVQTGGTWQTLTGNLEQSYYGVENADLFANVAVRLPQVRQILDGSFLWYLGGIASNPLAPWLAWIVVLAGVAANWQRVFPPMVLALATFVLSLVTISDLFITHYALLQVLLLGVVGVAAGALITEAWIVLSGAAPLQDRLPEEEVTRSRRQARLGAGALALLLLLWLLLDVRAALGYHRLLAQSGGLADHSDASYHLAYYLRYNGMGAPIALDWGMDATVRYLTEGTVTPVEIFGYNSPDVPDAGYTERLAQFIGNPDNVYLLHASGAEVFHGRRAGFESAAAAQGMTPHLEASFAQRDGTPLYEIWRLEPPTREER